MFDKEEKLCYTRRGFIRLPMKTLSCLVCCAALVALTGCGSSRSPLSAPKPLSEQFGIPLYGTTDDAIRYVCTEMEKGNTPIMLRLKQGASMAKAREIALGTKHRARTFSVRCEALGDMMVFHPRYVDGVLMLRVFRGDAPESSLTTQQLEALNRARAVVADVKSRYSSDYDRALALHDHLVSRHSYDEGSFHHSSPASDLLISTTGNCDAYARVYWLLLHMAGIENLYVSGVSRRGINHGWNLVKIDGEWIHVDCTSDDPVPDVPGRSLRTFFGLPDQKMEKLNSWERTLYPRSDSLSLWWPTKRGLCFDTVDDLVSYCERNGKSGECIVARVEELKDRKNRAMILIGESQKKRGKAIISSFRRDDDIPSVIECYIP